MPEAGVGRGSTGGHQKTFHGGVWEGGGISDRLSGLRGTWWGHSLPSGSLMMRPLFPTVFFLKLLGTFVTFAQQPDPSASCSINCGQGLLTLHFIRQPVRPGQPTQGSPHPHVEAKFENGAEHLEGRTFPSWKSPTPTVMWRPQVLVM